MKSLSYLSLLLLACVFSGCTKSEDDDVQIPLSNAPTSKWVVASGSVFEKYSNMPIGGAKIYIYFSSGIWRDTVTDSNGNYSMGFYVGTSENDFDLVITSDSLLRNSQTGNMAYMYSDLHWPIHGYSDLGTKKQFYIQSLSVVNVGLENLDGLDEEIYGSFIVNGDTQAYYGPIPSDYLSNEIFVAYGDSVSLKAIIQRANKPTVIVEKIVLSGPLKEQKIVLGYK